MKELWELYISFFRIGILTFGGGLAMLPMLKYELVEKRSWIRTRSFFIPMVRSSQRSGQRSCVIMWNREGRLSLAAVRRLRIFMGSV